MIKQPQPLVLNTDHQPTPCNQTETITMQKQKNKTIAISSIAQMLFKPTAFVIAVALSLTQANTVIVQWVSMAVININ
jgi:hypothetical protein